MTTAELIEALCDADSGGVAQVVVLVDECRVDDDGIPWAGPGEFEIAEVRRNGRGVVIMELKT